MRRVLIVSIAILVVAFATTAVRAGEQQVSDRLLEILKERQIISENEYAELSDIANEMQEDQRLESLDASITEYLAKEGDEAGVTSKHKPATGFGFTSGNFELWIGGLFQFEYYGVDRKNAQDTNNFWVKEARFYFMGKAFVEGFTYKFQWQGAGSGVTLLDAYGNFDLTEGVQIRGGQFKVPYSRQLLIDAGKLDFMNRSIVVDVFAPGRDIGLMVHDQFAEGENDFAWGYAVGIFNGDGTNVAGNDNNWFGWVIRGEVYPMGMVAMHEGDFTSSDDVKFGIAGSFASVRNRPLGTTVKNDLWEIDGVVTLYGIYLTGEYHHVKINPDGGSSSTNNGWFLQGSWQIMDTDFAVMGRYSMIDWDRDTGLKETTEWVLGVAWYPEGYGHPFKFVAQFGQIESDEESGGGGGSPVFDYEIDYSEFLTYLERTRFFRVGFQLDW